MSTDPSRLIAALARDQVNLDLKTVDLCFLAGTGRDGLGYVFEQLHRTSVLLSG